jgi:hypothetical protein
VTQERLFETHARVSRGVRGCVWGAARILTGEGASPIDPGLLDGLEALYQDRADLHPDPPKGQRRDKLLAQAWHDR